MPLRTPDSSFGPFKEQTTVIISATVKDDRNQFVPGSALDALTWTLFLETDPYPIINSRSSVNGIGSVDESGQLTIELTPEDMQMVSARVQEKHRLLIEWTYDDDKRGAWEISLTVDDLKKVV